MKIFIKVLFLLILLLGLSLLLARNLHLRQGSVCLQQQKALLSQASSGVSSALFTYPQCDISGAYLRQQCSLFTQKCWCVDSRGTKLTATEVSIRLGKEPAMCRLNKLEYLFMRWQLRVEKMAMHHLSQPTSKSLTRPVAKL